jgi:DNA-binding NtrC family response regulator
VALEHAAPLADAGVAAAAPGPAAPQGPYKEARVQAALDFERTYLEQLLARAGGNVSRAAKEAGVDRKYLYRLLWRHGMR